ncbi:hypothetical protein BYT27DRAFT_7213041 [Phlegmacium glaucopus]|nr:hypothetical protein BYT27DRAFT_7213041 [Phlegmacium glaucopus]
MSVSNPSSPPSFGHNNFVVVAVVVVVVVVLSAALRIWIIKRRRGYWRSRTMFPAAPGIIPPRQQLPMYTRRNFRQPNRYAANRSTRANFVYQPTRPTTRTTTTLVQQPPSPNTRYSNSPVAEPPPFLSVTPPPEPRPLHFPIAEHEQPDFTLDLVERMRQVQVLMVEIHKLENESGGAVNHRQRIQELQRRVMELSDTMPATTTDVVGQRQVGSNIPSTNLPGLASVHTSEPPPAYVR